MDWSLDKAEGMGGIYQLIITRLTHGGRAADVTRFRGVPTRIPEYSNGDPFGDGAASFVFPAVTMFDDLTAADLVGWLADYSNVDLYWVPIVPDDPVYAGLANVANPLTNVADAVAPPKLLPAGTANRVRVWEGYIASMGWTSDESSAQLEIQCQGALYQHDRYLSKPAFIARPQPLEEHIRRSFDPKGRPQLRTRRLRVVWPAGWTKTAPAVAPADITPLTPVVRAGNRWTGKTSRNTGAWERTLTSYVQEMLAVLIVDEESGVTPGNQWTVQHDHTGVGRTPVLMVRDRFRKPDFALWVGTPGVSLQVDRDTTQSYNVMFGEGSDVGGVTWRNALPDPKGERTDYRPIAYDATLWPYDGKAAKSLGKGGFAAESFQKYMNGMSQEQAASSAAKMLIRDRTAGWAGTLTFKTDVLSAIPAPDFLNPVPAGQLLPRARIRAGMTVNLKGFLGTGETGMNFHIAQAQISPDAGTVTCTIDTAYRDLLSIEESIVRTRDPLTPSKLLRVGQNSQLIEDVNAPWDYSAGAGYIPRQSKPFHDTRPARAGFPYADWARSRPPARYPQYYVKCNANSTDSRKRWSGPIPILTSEQGTINRTEVAVYDWYGRVVTIPFHVSIYRVNVNAGFMPRDGSTFSAYLDGAFDPVDPATGLPWPDTRFLGPDQNFIIGWGNRSNGVYNRAGFSPGREPDGHPPTGLLVDEGGWSFNNRWHGFFTAPRPGEKFDVTDIQLYAMFYAEHTQPVYFMGRLYRQPQGSDH